MKKLLFFALVAVTFASCTLTQQSMREPNSYVEFQKDDFEFSGQVTGQATSTKILMIDWARLFNQEEGSVVKDGSMGINLADIPVIGGVIGDKTYGYALYNVLNENKGYDVVFYPQFTKTVSRPIGIGFLYSITTVETTTKLGKIKN